LFYVLDLRMDGVEAVVMEPERNLYHVKIPGVERESFSMTTPTRKTEALDNGHV
jgi:hypothetical protein